MSEASVRTMAPGARVRKPGRLAEGHGERKLLVLDTSYTLEMIRDRHLEQSLTCRDLGGFFSHVWTVHPFATLLTSDKWASRYGQPTVHWIAGRHTMIEGKIGRFDWLKRFFILNFLLSQIALFITLRRLILRERIDVIRVGSPLYLGLFGLALSRLCSIPLVVRVGGNYDQIRKTTGQPMEPRLMRRGWIEKRVERFVFPRADLVAGANQDNLDFALANGARPEKSTIFRYGNLIDERHFAAPEARTGFIEVCSKYGVEPENFLLYVGRLEKVKHPDHVVLVLAKAKAAGFTGKAILAGEGSMRGAVSALAEALGLTDRVVLAGNLNQAELAVLYAAAAVVVSPHTGRALSEAALGGAAVVAYDIDWQRELIENDRTGILIPHDDVEELGEAVSALAKDKPRRRLLGQALRERAREMLDPTRLDEHEREQYRKMLVPRSGK